MGTTPDQQDLSALIADIYDAALLPAQWPEVLKQICTFVGGHGSTLFAHDSTRAQATLFYNHNNDPKFLQLYVEKYIHLNPYVPAVTFPEVGRVVTAGELVADEELKQTRFYKEYQVPQGIVDSMFVNLEKSGTSHMTLSVIATDRTGVFDDGRKARLALLVPHVRRAVVISHIIAGHEADKADLASALGRVAFAAFLVDGSGRITFANTAATRLVEEGSVLRNDSGAIAAISPAANKALQDVIAAARAGDSAVGSSGVAVPLTDAPDDDRWLAHVLPLTSGARQHTIATRSAVAAIFVRKVGLGAGLPIDGLVNLYKLTSSEARVLRGVVEIGGVSQIAQSLGIAETTVKTHLQRLFAKMGVNRQVDLIRLVAEHASPFSEN